MPRWAGSKVFSTQWPVFQGAPNGHSKFVSVGPIWTPPPGASCGWTPCGKETPLGPLQIRLAWTLTRKFSGKVKGVEPSIFQTPAQVPPHLIPLFASKRVCGGGRRAGQELTKTSLVLFVCVVYFSSKLRHCNYCNCNCICIFFAKYFIAKFSRQ